MLLKVNSGYDSNSSYKVEVVKRRVLINTGQILCFISLIRKKLKKQFAKNVNILKHSYIRSFTKR